jgi:hypothetical protein
MVRGGKTKRADERERHNMMRATWKAPKTLNCEEPHALSPARYLFEK